MPYWIDIHGIADRLPAAALVAYKGSIGGFSVIECKNAIFNMGGGNEARDWVIIGDHRGGVGYNTLWLYGKRNGVFTPMAARTQFSKPSSVIAFVMDGDHNDGFAEFLVDGQCVGQFDLYNLGIQALVIDGLPSIAHKLEIKLTGRKNPCSTGFDAHIYGGLALSLA